MKAVVFEDGRPQILQRPDPRPTQGEAVVRVLLAGICGTDLEIARGYLDFDGIPGHEFVGIVEASPDPGWIGRRVVGEINASCGRCRACHRDQRRHCPQRTVLGILGRDGAFAERVALPQANLHRVPDHVPDAGAVFAEPLAAACRIPEQLVLEEGMRTLVLGDGRLGQLCALVLARAGVPPVVCGRHRSKLERLRRMGLHTVDSSARLPRGFDLIVEATGSPTGLEKALRWVRPEGTIVLKSTYHGASVVPLAPVVIDEVTVIGSRCGPFPPALSLLSHAPEIIDGMVSGEYPLDEAERAFTHARSSDALKVLLRP